MTKDFVTVFENFKKQSVYIKNLIFVQYFHAFIVGLGDVFINIMIYDITSNLSYLILYNLIRAVGAISSFSLSHWLLRYGYNIRKTYIYFVSLLTFSFSLLYLSNYNLNLILLFGFMYGFSIGVFWFGQHHYSFNHIKKSEVDFFSSMLSLGKEVFTIVVPLVAVVSFYVSETILKTETYNVMMLVLVVVSVFMLFLVKKMDSFYPTHYKTSLAVDILKKDRLGVDFYGFNISRAVMSITAMVFLTFVSLEALKTAINVGIVELITGLLSIFLVSKLSNPKHSNNRIRIMFFSLILMVIAYFVLLVSGFSAVGYVIFSLVLIIANPMFNTTQKIVDFYTIEILRVEGSYSLGIFYRELVLAVAKVVTGILLYLVVYAVSDTFVAGCIMMGILISSIIGQYIFSKKIFDSVHIREEVD